MSNGNPIIIKGDNSISVVLYKDVFPQDPADTSRHHSDDRKITGVEITDENTQQTTSCAIPANGKCTIKIHHSL